MLKLHKAVILTIFLMVVLLLAITACGGAQPAAKITPAPTKAAATSAAQATPTTAQAAATPTTAKPTAPQVATQPTTTTTS